MECPFNARILQVAKVLQPTTGRKHRTSTTGCFTPNLFHHKPDVGPTHNRHICKLSEHTTPAVQQSLLRTTLGWYRCAQPRQLAAREQLRKVPFCLIPRVLDVVESQRAVATVIAPKWPAQPWYQRLVKLSIARPLKLPQKSKIYWSMDVVPEPCRNTKWQIYAWRIFGVRA